MRLATIGAQVRKGPTSSAPGSVPESVPHPPPTQSHGHNPPVHSPTPPPITPQDVATTVGYSAAAEEIGRHHPHRQNAPAVSQITPIAPPTPATGSVTALAPPPNSPSLQRANLAKLILGDPTIAQPLVDTQIEQAWQRAGGQGQAPQLKVSDLSDSELRQFAKTPTYHGFTAGRAGGVVASEPALIRLATLPAQSRHATRQALAHALSDVRGVRRDRRKTAVRAAVQQILKGVDAPAGNYLPQIARAAIKADRKTGVDASLLVATTGQETAYGSNRGPSTADARGVGQFIPGTRDSILQQTGLDAWAGDPSATQSGQLSQKDVNEQVLAMATLLKQGGVISDPSAALSSYSGGYADSAYNNPILTNAENFTGLNRFGQGGHAGGGQSSAAPQQPQGLPHQELLKWIKPTESWSEVAGELGTQRGQAEIFRLTPEFQTALVSAAKQAGAPVEVTEGWRSRARQEYLYTHPEETTGMVAAPGTSAHETGNAADLANVTPALEQALADNGIVPLAGDPGHYSLATPSSSSTGGPSSGSGITTGGVSAPSSGSAPIAPSSGSNALSRIRERRNRGSSRGTPVQITPIQAPAFSAGPTFATMAPSAAQQAIAGDDARSAEVQAIMQRAGLL